MPFNFIFGQKASKYMKEEQLYPWLNGSHATAVKVAPWLLVLRIANMKCSFEQCFFTITIINHLVINLLRIKCSFVFFIFGLSDLSDTFVTKDATFNCVIIKKLRLK
ncbi:unnamed protein product [Cuscuta epithymum]|uniref:Uncharacterized protein n=1 Tax=Cuscuta epithymum TaxID=186058 RepID=A0AAV0C4A1_9ASTE|nr:unnamed protein product [Cuscuta epithymum]